MDRNGLADEPIFDSGRARLHVAGRRLDRAFAALDALPPGTYANCLYRSSGPKSPPAALVERLALARWVQHDEHPLTWIEPDHHLRVHQAWVEAGEGDDRLGRARVRTSRPLEPVDGSEAGAAGWHDVTVIDFTGVAGIDVVFVALQPSEASREDDDDQGEVAIAPSWFRGTTSFRLRLDKEGFIEGGTLNVAEVLGRPLVELLGNDVRDLCHPDDLTDAGTAWTGLIAGDVSTIHTRSRMRMADDSYRWFDTTSWNVLDVPTVGAVITEFRDVQHQVEAEEANAATSRAHARLVRVFDEVDDMVMVGELEGGLSYVNEAAAAVLGADAVGNRLLDQLGTELRAFGEGVVPLLQRMERWTGDIEIQVDGEPRIMATTITPVHEPDYDDIYYGVIMRDVTAERSHARALSSQARRDPLTRLPNRLALMEHLDRCRAGEPGTSVSVCFIDLDNLKVVNDGLGHSAGDRLLRAVGAQLLNQKGTVARFGGDEFVVVYRDHTPAETAAAAQQLLAAIRRVEVLGVASHITASIGVASCPCDQLDPEAIIRDADAAMYVAKREGRSKVVHFDDGMRSVVARRFVIESSLREAVESGTGIEVHFQPVVAMDTGLLSGFEALARWSGASPTEFIPVAEDSGLIVPLGRLALDRSLAALVEITEVGPEHAGLRMGVNVSGRQLLDPGFRATVMRALADHAIEPTRLVLELTESVLIDPSDEIAGVLRALRDAGVSLALDDFGSGYSSLGYLRRYPIDVLKLDNTYTQSLLHDEGTRIIVEAVVTMARRLGLRVVAEGVETEAQREVVRDLGIDWAQGYLLGKPVPLPQTLADLTAPPGSADPGDRTTDVSGA